MDVLDNGEGRASGRKPPYSRRWVAIGYDSRLIDILHDVL